MVFLDYKGGAYHGSVKTVKKKQRKGSQAKVRKQLIPHGRGTFIFKGIRYEGMFKDGFESGFGTIYWPDGNSYEGYFVNGRPNAELLQAFHENTRLKSEALRHEALIMNHKDDIAIEKETSMALALALDRCQEKLDRVYDLGVSGATEAQLYQARFL